MHIFHDSPPLIFYVYIVFSFRPDLIQYDKLQKSNAMHNLDNAFTVAEEKLGLTRLLDPEGMYGLSIKIKIVAKSLASCLVGTGFVSWYRSNPEQVFKGPISRCMATTSSSL